MQNNPAWSPRLFRLVLVGVTLLLALMQAYLTRHYIDGDGIAYLDLGAAWWRGDWRGGLNATWSPLYSWITGGVLVLIQPPTYWQFATVKVVNVLLFLGSARAFAWFLHEVSLIVARDQSTKPLPLLLFQILAWSTFLGASLNLTPVGNVTPDLLVNLFGFLAAALIAKARRRGARGLTSLLLGLFLGMGYLAKAPFLPLSIVFLILYLRTAGTLRLAVRHGTVVTIAAALFIVPYVTALSWKYQRFTLSDAGRLNYLWFVNGVERYRWQTTRTDLGCPIHPPQQIFQKPAVFSFAEQPRGSYPYWYDPSYWCAGLTPRFDLWEQLTHSARMTGKLIRLVITHVGVQIIGTIILWWWAWRSLSDKHDRQLALQSVKRQYPWFVIAAVGLCMYVLVYIERRYVPLFLILAIVGLLASLRFGIHQQQEFLRRARLVTVFFVLMPVLMFGSFFLQTLQSIQDGEGPHAHPHWFVARDLQRRGVRSGDNVAVIGYPFDCSWARLGGFRVVAEISEADQDDYWRASEKTQTAVRVKLKNLGVAAMVFRSECSGDNCGVAIRETPFRVLLLDSYSPNGRVRTRPRAVPW